MKTDSNWPFIGLGEIFSFLGSSEDGLTNDEAKNRLQNFGLNKLADTKPDSYLVIFLRQFQSPLIYILLLASVVLVLIQDYLDAIVIAVVLFINAIIGTFQEGKANNIMQALVLFTKTEAVVVRQGKEVFIPDTEVVPGDILVLREGDKISADARIIYTSNFYIDQSSLTGESLPVIKNNKLLADVNLPTADQENMVFKGTYVVRGTAKAVVVSTGLKTVMGKISTQLVNLTTDIPIKKDIKKLSHLILFLVALVNIFLLTVGIYYGHSLLEMFKTVVAVSVSLIPEGLPVVITLVLALGVWRMGKRQALVKKLQAVEALGQATVIAVDKTGTITKNELMVSHLFVDGREFIVSGDGYSFDGNILFENHIINPVDHKHLRLIGKIVTACADAQVSYLNDEKRWKVIGDPTEAALLVLGQKLGFDKLTFEEEHSLVFDLPFNSNTKYHGTVHQLNDKFLLSVVGAPEVIIDKCSFILDQGKKRPITKEDKDDFKNNLKRMSALGLRVLALAFNDQSPREVTHDDLPGLTLVGLCGMSDVLRLEARSAIRQAKEAGIKVVMITGDHQTTASAIAQSVGIYNQGDRVLTGNDLDKLTDQDLDLEIKNVTVFARVTPEHKLRIIQSYKRIGETIAMTGDGVNDALSLVAADLGIGMGKRGTEVAKAASDIVLLDDNFSSIVAAIEEGRNIYRTIKKVVVYLISTGIGEMFTIIAAILLGLPIPITASQIIWLNLVTDGFLVAALAFEPKDDDLLRSKFTKNQTKLIDRSLLIRSFLMGAVMMAGALSLFIWSLEFRGDTFIQASTIALTILAVFQWYNVLNCRSEKKSIFSLSLFKNVYLLISFVVVIFLHLTLIYTSVGQKLFKVEPLSLDVWLIILVVGISIFLLEELRKFSLRFL